jgi:hypothetical protein
MRLDSDGVPCEALCALTYSLPTDYPDIKMNQIPILVPEVL